MRYGAPTDIGERPAERLAGDPHHAGRQQNQPGEQQQQVDGAAERADEEHGHQPGRHRPEGGARADEAEQPPGLPRVEERMGEAPGLDRRDDAETVHPDEEDRRQALEREEAERGPEQQHVRAEEQQRANRDGELPEPGRDARVHGHEGRQRDGHDGDRRRRASRRCTRGGTVPSEGPWRAGRKPPPWRCRGTPGGRAGLRRNECRRTAGAATS